MSRRPPPGTCGKLGICQYDKYCKKRSCPLAHPGGRINGLDNEASSSPSPTPPPVMERTVKSTKKIPPTPEQIREADRLAALEREAEAEKERKLEVEAEHIREVIRARKIKKDQEDAKRAADEEEVRRQLAQQRMEEEVAWKSLVREQRSADDAVSSPSPVVSSSVPLVSSPVFREELTSISSFDLDPDLFEDKATAADLTCSVCLMVAHEPPALPCGHLFCRSCLEAAPVDQRKCPQCRVQIKLSTCPPNVYVSRIVAGLKMHCPRPGCPTVLVPGALVKHVSECAHASVTCTRCDEVVKRQDKEHHVCASSSVSSPPVVVSKPSSTVEDDLRMRLAERDARLVSQAAQIAQQQREMDTLRSLTENLRAQLAKHQSLIGAMQAQADKRQAFTRELQTELEASHTKMDRLRRVVNDAFVEASR